MRKLSGYIITLSGGAFRWGDGSPEDIKYRERLKLQVEVPDDGFGDEFYYISDIRELKKKANEKIDRLEKEIIELTKEEEEKEEEVEELEREYPNYPKITQKRLFEKRIRIGKKDSLK